MKYKKILLVFLLVLLMSLFSLFTFAQGVGYIQIKCEPGAMVFLDNNFVGNTSLEQVGLILQDVPAGPYVIKIVKEGFEPQSVKIDLKVNEIYVYEVKSFIYKIKVSQSGEIETESIKQKVGSLLIETVPIECVIEIPALHISANSQGKKSKKLWKVSNIPVGNYTGTCSALGKKVKFDIEIIKERRQHLLVNIIKNEVKVIIPTWKKTFGNEDWDSFYSVISTSDGGYAAAGGKATGRDGESDAWVIKFNDIGEIEWQKIFGGKGNDHFMSIIQTSDDGYAIAGYTDPLTPQGKAGLVVKLDKVGSIQWSKSINHMSDDKFFSIIQTLDNGYALTGYTTNTFARSTSAWMVKLDSKGKIEHNEWLILGSELDIEYPQNIIQTNDEGYLIAGWRETPGTKKDKSKYSAFLIKINNKAEILWYKLFKDHVFYEFIKTGDGNFLGVGGANFKKAPWIIKLDKNGKTLWEKTLNLNIENIFVNYVHSVSQTLDNGFVLVDDYRIIKLDKNGNLEWKKKVEVGRSVDLRSVCQSTDGGYVVAGSIAGSQKNSIDDACVIKLDELGNF